MFFKTYQNRHKDYSSGLLNKKNDEKKSTVPPKASKVDDGDNEEQEFRQVDVNNMEDIMWELDKRAVNGVNRDIEVICDAVVAYKGEVVDTTQLPELLCEECEKKNSVLKCEICNQIFCPKCYNLCHARPVFGSGLHPHETDKDLFVRPIKPGDTSSVVVDNTFYLPDYECHEEYLTNTHDLSKPNTLATIDNYKTIDKVPSNQIVRKIMYKEGDVLVYIDPTSKEEVYGRVESDWDFRNDKAAPTLIRGEGGGLTWYVVRYLGVVTPKILELLEEDKPLDYDESASEETKRQEALMLEIPNLEGVGSSKLRMERLMASRINKRIAKMKKAIKFGPKHHLNPNIPKGFGSANDEDDSSIGAYDDHSSLCSSKGASSAVMASIDEDEMYDIAMPSVRNIKKGDPRANIISTRKLTDKELRIASLPTESANSRTLDQLVAAYAYINEVQAELNHEYYNPNDEEPLVLRQLKILLLPESSLTRVSDRLKLMQLRKKEKVRHALTKRFARLFGGWTAWAFSTWSMLTNHLRHEEHERAATFIQKQIRCFVKRNLLAELRFKSAALMHDRWKRLHAKFNYCRRDTPGAVTMDNKIYFRSIRDVNAYGRALRVALSKFVQVAERNRMEYLKESVKVWKDVVNDMQESDLRASHILPYDTNHDEPASAGRMVDLTEVTQKVHQDLYDEYISKTLNEVPEDLDWSQVDANPADDSRMDLNSILMGTERKVQNLDDLTEVTPPPWHPSVGFSDGALPPMKPLPNLVINDKKAPVNQPYPHSLSDIQKYNSFKAIFSGPTDYSFWVIPGRLAMGRLPLGRARRIGPVDSSLHTMIDCVPQLLITGVSSFISTLTPEEEAKEIEDYNKYASNLGVPQVDSIASIIQRDQMNARATLKDTILNLNSRIEDKNIMLRDYMHIEDAPIRASRGEHISSTRARHKAEKVRLKAKQQLLVDDLKNCQADLKRLSENVRWINYPLIHNQTPLYERMVPILWDIEQRLFNGETIYLYSKEGKGRSGMICAMVLGRLYGLSPTETLLRMQTYFNCQRSQLDKTVSANCPQLRRQQDLVCRIIQTTNNIYTGVNYRSQVDPETFMAENQHLKAGTTTSENIKEYSASGGGYIQCKTSYLMKQRLPSLPSSRIMSSPSRKNLAAITENGDMEIDKSKKSQLNLDLAPVKKLREATDEEKVGIEEIKDMYDETTIERGSKALVRPIEQRRPVYCDRPSQVHIDKTFSKLKKRKPIL